MSKQRTGIERRIEDMADVELALFAIKYILGGGCEMREPGISIVKEIDRRMYESTFGDIVLSCEISVNVERELLAAVDKLRKEKCQPET